MGSQADEVFTEIDQLRVQLLNNVEVFTGCRPVDEDNSWEILTRIENIILGIMTSLSKEEAPILVLPNRSSLANIRDIYYNNTQLFGSQSEVDSIVDDISCMLKVPRRSLHVLATSKGLIAGDLRYTEEDGTRIDCHSSSVKDATFQRLLDDNFCTKLSPCIMITGKGVPDVNSRLMVRKLWDTLHIPIFALVDADPYGIEIMSIYNLRVPEDALIPLTKRDESKLSSLLKRPYLTSQPDWQKEMELMQQTGVKAEIQSLAAIAPDFLTNIYLPNKLCYGGWV
ncbi:hypothetical protein INR49_013426 [Caranx melampygus]|nr:hypothetical protein INR49_013426 [Caranx melampygus]